MSSFRPTLCVMLGCLGLLNAAGCEELGPDARGEVPNSAVQRVGVERVCLPFLDVANVQGTRAGHGQKTLVFALRDGSRWISRLANPAANERAGPGCLIEPGKQNLVFDSNKGEICAEDMVLLSVRVHQLHRFSGRCRLGQFDRL